MGETPLVLYQNRLFYTELKIYDSELEEYVQLESGQTVTLTIKKEKEDTTNILKKVFTSENNSKDGEGIDIILTSAETKKDPGYYWWDIMISRISGEAEIVIPTSPCVIKPSISLTS